MELENYFDAKLPEKIHDNIKYYHPKYKGLWCDSNGVIYWDESIYRVFNKPLKPSLRNVFKGWSTRIIRLDGAFSVGLNTTRVCYECFHGVICTGNIIFANLNVLDYRKENLIKTPTGKESYTYRTRKKEFLANSIEEAFRRIEKILPVSFKTKDLEVIKAYMGLVKYPIDLTNAVIKKLE